jgi:hypothetical protein
MTAMPWRLCFLLAALMIVFAIAHMLALQTQHAVQGERLGAEGMVAGQSAPDARQQPA